MVQKANTTQEIVEAPARVNQTKRFLKVFMGRGLVVFGLVIVFLFIFTAVFGSLFAPYSPVKINPGNRLESPSAQHWLGTDNFGRDTLSRLIHGAGNSLMVGVVAVGIAAVVGIIAGMLAGFFGGWINIVIMRIVDALMSFPMILLALLIAALLGSGLRNVMIALGVAMIPVYARLMCGQVLAIRENDYVLAGKSMGASSARLLFNHILPNSFPPLIVLVTMQIGSAILAEAGLSYLGIGITPPTPSWGAMVNDGFRFVITNPLLSFVPGLAIMLVVFAFSMVGDGLRDALDPRLRGTI
ncbi:MAG TPA: ABC transporter permease [Dehalococcoidales bacterium]|nr:ABC transporter permease [Dehalococcoidales bacterium]